MKVYILIADVGSYSDRTVSNLAVFLDKEKAESKRAELTKVPEVPENWLELYAAERENALANFNKVRKELYENAKNKLVEIEKGRATIMAKLTTALNDNNSQKIREYTRDLEGFGKRSQTQALAEIARFEDKSYEGHHFFFPEPKDWKNYNYRAKYSSDELYFEELEVSE